MATFRSVSNDCFRITSQVDPARGTINDHPHAHHMARVRDEAVRTDGEDGRPRTYIQWQGSKLCVDFDCPCGHGAHLDDAFLFAVRCPACGTRYELVPELLVRVVPEDEELSHSCVVDLKDDK